MTVLVKHWAAAAALSIVSHGAAAGLIVSSTKPAPIDQHPVPKSQIELVAYRVDQSEIATITPSSEPGKEAQSNATELGQNAIPVSMAAALAPSATLSKPAPATGILTNPTKVVPDNVKTTLPLTTNANLRESQLKVENFHDKTLIAVAMAATTPSTGIAVTFSELNSEVAVKNGMPNSDVAVKSTVVSSDVVTQSQQTHQKLPPHQLNSRVLALASTTGKSPITDQARDAEQIFETSVAHTSQAPDIGSDTFATSLDETEFSANVQVAALAWSGDENIRVDPVSIAAIQSFMTPSELANSDSNTGSAKDSIQALLAEVPCSRLQVEFNPDTGQLELRGHIPEAGLRNPVTAALREKIGQSIPLIDSLLILPRPQCEALNGISNAGLPQSTDQLNNPRLVGADTHVRQYEFVAGDRLVLDLGAPDYDAFIYVDYYDSNGNVIHLVPNDNVTLTRHPAKTVAKIGADREDGNFLAVTIGPPFGQEIGTAFAASVPLYAGNRPTVELASEYLVWLRDQILKARSETPDFKGEWVYFFVSTSHK